MREGTENKAAAVEAVLQPVGSLGFGILCLECHGKAAGRSDPKPNHGNPRTIKTEIKHDTQILIAIRMLRNASLNYPQFKIHT